MPGNKFQWRGQGQPERSPVLFSGRQKGDAGSGAHSCPPPQPPKELCCFHLLKTPAVGKSPSTAPPGRRSHSCRRSWVTARPRAAPLPAPCSSPPTAAGRALGLGRSGALPGKQGQPELLPVGTALGRQLQRTGREQARKAAGKGLSGPQGCLCAWERSALVLTDKLGEGWGRERRTAPVQHAQPSRVLLHLRLAIRCPCQILGWLSHHPEDPPHVTQRAALRAQTWALTVESLLHVEVI